MRDFEGIKPCATCGRSAFATAFRIVGRGYSFGAAPFLK